jgi:hypothetical protein
MIWSVSCKSYLRPVIAIVKQLSISSRNLASVLVPKAWSKEVLRFCNKNSISRAVNRKFMQKQALFYSIAVLGFSALSQLSVVAEVLPQNIWQQTYTPTRLQWLFINLHGRGERTPCGVYDLDGRSRAWYEWQSPNARDNQLGLSIFTLQSATSSVSDRNFCIVTALGNLKLEAFRLETSPSPVELHHFQFNQDGQALIGTYQCLVPAAMTSVDLDIGQFESVCR